MSEKSAAPDGQVVIKGRVSEHGLPVWQMPERVAIAFPEGRCRIVRGRHGCFLYHPADHFLGKAIETYGECCELELGAYRSLLGEGAVLVEVGANAGYLTVPLARMVGTSGRVVAFEPQPAIHRLLCANVALNGLPQVDCVHAAVGAGEDVVEVPVIDPAVGGNFGAVSLVDVVDGARTAAVPLVSLDRACGGLERLDVVKIDVEGMELEVLKGARELIGRFRPVLVPENDRASRSAELVAHLLSLDYRCYWLIHPLYNPGNFFGVAADLYPRTASYNMLCVPAERPQPSGLAPITDPAQHPLAGRR
ncbi:MAG: FkbM family methyltransferase [Rubrivivax sp.]|jgi:FkbM family methyltransferase|nr:FkbM family methyltransferase [Rubrivivax sp.]